MTKPKNGEARVRRYGCDDLRKWRHNGPPPLVAHSSIAEIYDLHVGQIA